MEKIKKKVEDRERKIEESIKEMNKKYKEYMKENYKWRERKEEKEEREKIAEEIYKTYNKKNKEKLYELYKKIKEEKEIMSEILKYEMKNYKRKGEKKEYEEEVGEILKRYHWRAGGYEMDEKEWRCYKKKETKAIKNKEYEIMEGEILYVNTINPQDGKKKEIIEYIETLRKRISEVDKEREVETEIRKTGEGRNKILIWCREKENDIGL